MYPAQTSLVPTQIALVRFLDQGGNILGAYPYWYLGTTPYRFLTGPVLPFSLTFLHRILPLNLFEIFFILIAASWLIGGGGVYWLVRELKGKKEAAFLAGLFYLFGPIMPFLFRFSNGLYLMAFSFLPFCLLFYSKLLKKWSRRKAVITASLIAFEILLDSLILPTLVLGMGAVFLTQVGWKRAEERIKASLGVLFSGWLIATFWYTPSFWLTLLGAPSLAGKGLAGVIISLGKILPASLALGVAVFSVKFFKKRDLFRDFCFSWLFIFGCLSLLRFLSDPDFWLDWTAWGTELQFGLALGLGLITSSLFSNRKQSFAYLLLTACFLSFYLLFFGLVTNRFVLKTLQPEIFQTEEYQLGSQLEKITKPGERVFLSGTTAFWLNAFFDLAQVRGGVDQASTDSKWRELTWQVREGIDPEKQLNLLKDLEVSYLVVHTQESAEFYHDFTYPEKFENQPGFEKIYDQKGDRVYRIGK